ncbi:hypothetical protein CYLTODRAFT_419458 [Cylindrobasidium torrendii FP15055 ss-10]|uniref:tRNA-splicing endonuclease subunit Sen2 n=1 Tax=Cylindrobasidium torrendii FP15055 ss-10 TaxID=1314674 RepID=A0A0D7BKX9_9AGAR|nr:hypothetical protein CYLTODRAFT_419458 [Cylindrobasidium torrendii FP15055 ss-10]
MQRNRGKNTRGRGGKGGWHNNKQIYSTPLPPLIQPILPPILHTATLGLALQIATPVCTAYYSSTTTPNAVWIVNTSDINILWRRGFFGKGDLSRSEPSWVKRVRAEREGRDGKPTPEALRALRRAERRQFKLDRAQAIASVAAEAEAIFASGGDAINPALSGPNIPSAATWRPQAKTDINTTQAGPSSMTQVPDLAADLEGDEKEEAGDEPDVVNMEHLQLTMHEAWFLLWNLGCLVVRDADSDNIIPLESFWLLCQRAHTPISPSFPAPLAFDNPFLVHYAVYHHYRALGWVVRGGLKFCVDWLLYKKGPVFSHAEFALTVCPVYEDPADDVGNLQNAKPFSWTWLSTINRVNTQVQKTLILVYVTIPAKARVSPEVLNTPAGLAHYSVHEVVVRRFIPARMRD